MKRLSFLTQALAIVLIVSACGAGVLMGRSK